MDGPPVGKAQIDATIQGEKGKKRAVEGVGGPDAGRTPTEVRSQLLLSEMVGQGQNSTNQYD